MFTKLPYIRLIQKLKKSSNARIFFDFINTSIQLRYNTNLRFIKNSTTLTSLILFVSSSAFIYLTQMEANSMQMNKLETWECRTPNKMTYYIVTLIVSTIYTSCVVISPYYFEERWNVIHSFRKSWSFCFNFQIITMQTVYNLHWAKVDLCIRTLLAIHSRKFLKYQKKHRKNSS